MAKYHQGKYIPKNPAKYVGSAIPTYRSSWEKTVFIMCDTNPAILKWGSECIQIKYIDPFTKKLRTYFPDLLITYVDAKGNTLTELVEIKPLNQTLVEKAKGKKNIKEVAINHAKWNSAIKWCQLNGIKFRILTEQQIYGRSSKKRRKKK